MSRAVRQRISADGSGGEVRPIPPVDMIPDLTGTLHPLGVNPRKMSLRKMRRVPDLIETLSGTRVATDISLNRMALPERSPSV